jgi:magnesium-transporting ATPase (P-type)
VYLLLAATLISLVAWFIERANARPGAEGGEALPFDAIVIVLILMVNAVLGYLQEAKAEQAVDALAKMTAPQTSVLRGGKVSRIDTAEVVPGDILVLGEGDSVSADGRLFAAASLRIAEASLTGESVPVGKKPATLEQAKALGDRTNMVFNGTAVTQGTGRAIITGTGMDTQVGKIAEMLSHTNDEATPLQREMNRVSKILGVAVVLIAVVVLIALATVEGFHDIHDVIDSLLLAVSLAVAAVPEGLATILTVVLALGVQRMAQHHAIVKKLSSVETLGSASVICSDKTGTLTRNEMTVERVVTPSGEVQITGTGYASQGRMVAQDGSDDIDAELAHEVFTTLAAGSIANDGDLRQGSSGDSGSSTGSSHDGSHGTWEAVGDPTEVSLIVAARKVKAVSRFSNFERVAEIPFTSERKRMAVIAKDNADSGKLTVFAKGAPDVLLGYCTHIAVGNAVRRLTNGDRETILDTVERLSSQAYRTLGQAYRPLETQSLADVPGVRSNAAGQVTDIAEQSETIETGLVWAGMVGIIDPPRTEVRASVTEAHRAGIRTVMITGDHPLTASRIASDLGIIEAGETGDTAGKALTGDQLDDFIDNAALDKATSEVSVYARVAPEHKLKIVESLQRQGNIVAMTGDGVNDAPAVKSADIGVAMGITGTEVTKESANMILADDNFSTIVSAVREGRGIFDNIRKFLRYLLSSNVGEVFTVFGGVMFAGFLGITQPGTAWRHRAAARDPAIVDQPAHRCRAGARDGRRQIVGGHDGPAAAQGHRSRDRRADVGRYYLHRHHHGRRHADRHGYALGRRIVHRPQRFGAGPRGADGRGAHDGLHDSRVRPDVQRPRLALALAKRVQGPVRQQVAVGRHRDFGAAAACGDLRALPQRRLRHDAVGTLGLAGMHRPGPVRARCLGIA